MYGRIMMARMSPAATMPLPPVFGPPRASNTWRITGARKNRPQNPYTTLGMAASSSIRNAPTRFTHGGAISDMYAALATPSGTAISMAISDVTVVPHTNASTPNVGLPPPGGFGTHSVLVNNRYSPARDRTGQASQR